ncbi:MAG: HesB/IscA family protein [Leptolyngbya sp. IPPAS B-1204]|uniref:Iron-sulfur cluster assembly accessory protein n=1 Tax=Leptolyngbya sp. NK1-12 TaxID=2547451 RepID=A0AA97AKQ2_9CYAN|nr:iron-sulfur cluster assembly accessory protein [Leptolyngbya sp. NK1-12]MBF2050797.1 iron-sulfur cluster assembly accessory protein [Elainella sp. C42_A2020_010]RNJ67291.1 MAG: iron-sulfur cluster assembly accessory protein [Leptolyngbya sp. IPPAS B-1204]WNZ26446.1 iron-sulfur cluster assembly accessory protein [Leptolyngbya sp. NK1-12]
MIHLSQAAIGEVQRMQSKCLDARARFRLGVQAGGCADWFYTLDLDPTTAPDDRVVDCDGIQVVIDSQSWTYLNGLSLDYSEDLMGGGFRFHNPNAVSHCGCGNSFSVDPARQATVPSDDCML